MTFLLPIRTWIYLTLFWLGLLTTGCVGQKTPSISFISKNISTDIGGNVVLNCTIKDGKEYPILWMRLGGKREPFPISTGPSLLVHDKRFSLSNNPVDGSYILYIKDVQKTDEAKYQCQVVVSLNNMVTADVDLKVKMPPVITEDDAPVKRVVAGKPFDLGCEASGYPTPTITWRKLDGSLLPNGKETFVGPKLSIKEVRREDRGSYICKADNSVGKGHERAQILEVEYIPSIEVPKPRIPQAAYYEAHLVCEIEAFPPPAINWKRGEDIISNNATFKISHFASSDDKTTSTLKVLSVGRDQFGLFTCEASNRHGSSRRNMELYESKTPICPPLCGNTNLNGATLDGFSWTTITTLVLAGLMIR